MISTGTGCRVCSFKTSTVVDYDTDVATCPKCGTKYAVIRTDHLNIETGEGYQSVNLGEQLSMGGQNEIHGNSRTQESSRTYLRNRQEY